MPRRYWVYPSEYQMLHVASSAGASLLAAGLLVVLANLLWAMVRGERAPANPWEARTLEWRTASPPPVHNFSDAAVEVERDHDPYDYWRPLRRDAAGP